MNKKQLINHLQLEPHCEGGYFRRTYSSPIETTITISTVGQRLLMSSIYYLLTDDSPVGYFHRNQSDIIHYWHAGSSLSYFLISPEGEFSCFRLGNKLIDGEHLQFTVPGGYWKATLLEQGDYGLLSEAVSPGFQYADMSLASCEQLRNQYPTLEAESSLDFSVLCKPI